ncbi:hypothetical protein [Fischerella sp. PCC 9605]|uniref:hypothetical protein n=1 Tax=Fischerella sp. PCC 9605 TaxID=1173024 RepID=UPI00047C664D|nr:hypothetical protein [Fischerella sp. PCC 9605]
MKEHEKLEKWQNRWDELARQIEDIPLEELPEKYIYQIIILEEQIENQETEISELKYFIEVSKAKTKDDKRGLFIYLIISFLTIGFLLFQLVNTKQEYQQKLERCKTNTTLCNQNTSEQLGMNYTS